MTRPTPSRTGGLAALVADVACAAARAGPLPDLLQRCADSLAGHLPAALVQFWVLNAAEDALVRQAAAPGPDLPAVLAAVPVRRTVPGRLVRDRRPVVTDRVPADLSLPDPAWVRRQGVAAFAGYPLVVDGRAVGALAVLTRRGAGGLLADLGPVAQVIAVAVERKRLEDRVRQAEAFEAVGRAAAGLAHDLNNLLTLVAGYGDLVRPHLPTGSPALALTGELDQAVTRAAGLARRLVALGRPAAAAPVLALNAAVADLAPLVRQVAGPRVAVAVHLDPVAGRVRVELGQLEQVLLNLAGNARDAMPQGGILTIRTSRTAGRHVRLTVADTGSGMDAATRARVFEPYFTTKPAGRGTGLGLATVRGIVERAGGRVAVESEPGQGTAVHLDLPPADDTSMGGATAGPGGRPTILVAEADDAVRALTRQVLVRHGYTILDAADGPAALRAADRHPGPIHLLVADVGLPELSGRQLADRLAARRPGVKVLYLAGLGADAAEPGATAILPKPFRPADLAHRVAELIGP